ncbi:DUF1479-domain-containing protein [Sporormia fimetaria CBS 119925]|uniref:DUF1479-domain-containing protein n=1 Tax=Sporormia fimetaria CBS 119925 TaxID=1340428 RepID=A0A6A6VNN0_9PLEO|nr:DUF1479-domain-containing protein [Sporormia fimetaria CBS 119925]
MFPLSTRCLRRTITKCIGSPFRAASTQAQKRAGDISDAFVSLSGQQFTALPPEYADLKRRLIHGHEDAVRDSWDRLLRHLREDIPEIVELGPKVVPEIDFKDIDSPSDRFSDELKKRGVAVVREVVTEEQALQLKDDLKDYIRQNPNTKAFPATNPQVFELYWSRPQVLARAHPNMLKAQRFLMSYWHNDPSAPVSTKHPTTYADRLRIRLPGDSKFALGPHVDGGSIERWDERGYGRGGVYDDVWNGEWENFDPWEAACRLRVVSDMHQGVGACSMFRMYQGWLSMSTTGPGEGTLLVNPLLQKATAYYLLRPFFTAKRGPEEFSSSSQQAGFLDADNWTLEPDATSIFQGAALGHGQELSSLLHPHLHPERSMIHMPRVRPGDYVVWHCDTIHSVDKVHAGTGDSSVMYIPCCPLTEGNAKGLARQRACFEKGVPSPDFGGGEGESRHVGRVRVEDMRELVDVEGCRGMGLMEWDTREEGLGRGEREVLGRANEVLGFRRGDFWRGAVGNGR